MTIEQIIHNKESLNTQLKLALSTMEKKNTINEIKLAIKENQNMCPHFDSNYNWAIIDDICPYCGKKINL